MSLFDAQSLQITNPAALGTTCGKCQRHKYAISPRMEVWGGGKSGLMIITGMPDRIGDSKGTPLTGAAYRYLDRVLGENGLDLARDCLVASAVACYGKSPVQGEITACMGRLWSNIAKYQPKCILTLGMAPLESLLSHRWNKKSDDDSGLGEITRWLGWAIPDRQTKCFVVPTWGLKHLLANVDDTPAYNVWFRRHIRKAINCLHEPMPVFKPENDCIEVLTSDADVISCFHSTEKQPWFVFDYETSGLKPYREEQKIWYIGVGDGFDHAFCFPTTCKKAVRYFRALLADDYIGKVAHNIAYEDLWSRVKLDVDVKNWRMCSLLASHIQNQNSGLIGLKFQAYVRLGLVDYSSHISPYLETPLNKEEESRGANKLNSISKAPAADVMKYCAIDCLSTYRIATLIDKELKLECL